MINGVELNGYSLTQTARKFGIISTSLHYWLNGMTHTKRRGPLTVLIEQEEEEVVFWCKDMAEMGHGMDLIQLK